MKEQGGLPRDAKDGTNDWKRSGCVNEDFFPDDGIAFAEKRLNLPENIMLTDLRFQDQLLTEVQPGRTMLCIPMLGYMFSFLIPMKPDDLAAHFKSNVFLTLTSFRAGPPQVGATGEKFRDVLCEVE